MTNYHYEVLSFKEFADSLSTNKHFIYGINSYFYHMPFRYIDSDDKWVAIQYQRGRLFGIFLENKYPNIKFSKWEPGYFNESALCDIFEAVNCGAVF